MVNLSSGAISLLLLPTLAQSACPHGKAFSNVPAPKDALHQRAASALRGGATTTTTTPDDGNDIPSVSSATTERNAATTARRRRMQQYSCWTLDAYEQLYDLLEVESNAISTNDERGHFLGGIVRLAAHDFMDYDQNSANPGGPDGCLDLDNAANAGLNDIWCDDHIECPLKAIYDTYYSFATKADFWVAAATLVIKLTSDGELDMPFKFGRVDQSVCDESSDRLPEATGCTEVEETFLDRMGLSWTDAVALMGAHTLGRGDVDFSGHDGTWVNNDDESVIFDKMYYDESILRPWRPQSNVAGTDWTWGGNDRTIVSLNTDLCLYFDIPDGDDQTCCTNTDMNCFDFDGAPQCSTADTVRPEAFEAFTTFYDGGSRDNTPFFEAFAVSWAKAVELGTTTLYDLTYYDTDCVVRTRSNAPNIIVMQPDDLPFYDAWSPPPGGSGGTFASSTTTPNIERLRTQGLQMMQAYTASPKCGTSRYSTITGRYPSRSASGRSTSTSQEVTTVTIATTKLTDVGDDLDCSEDNLAKLFQRNDYRTGFFGKWHLHSVREPNSTEYASYVTGIESCGFDVADGVYMENLEAYNETTNHNLEWMTGLAIDFINDDTTHGDKPFFMYFNPTVPHSSGDVLDALTNGDCTDTTNGVQPEPLIEGMNKEFGADGQCRAYRSDVISRAGTNENKDLGAVWLDDAVGALLTALEDKGELDNTLFLFQLDHGMGAKSQLYEGGTRIPQFIHFPNAFGTSGMTFDGMVSTIDIGPTLLDYAEISTVSPGYYDMDGWSWKDAVGSDSLEAEWKADRCLLFEYDTDRAVRCTCEKYAEIEGTQYYFDLCDMQANYINYPDDDPEDTNEASAAVDRVELLDDVLSCYETKTKPDADKDFTTSGCSDSYATMAPNPAPSMSPTATCTDVDSFVMEGSTTVRNCAWVATRASKRCPTYGCECPVTCSMCRDCQAESTT